MTSLHNHTRLLVVAALLSILTACGSPVGPSEDEVRLDMQDLADRKYKGMIQLVDFNVVGRQMLSENRVRIEVTAGIALDEARVAQVRQHSKAWARTFGGWSDDARDAERFYKRFQGRTDETLLLYQKNGHGMWQFAGVLPGNR